jgi:hypothetical protein
LTDFLVSYSMYHLCFLHKNECRRKESSKNRSFLYSSVTDCEILTMHPGYLCPYLCHLQKSEAYETRYHLIFITLYLLLPFAGFLSLCVVSFIIFMNCRKRMLQGTPVIILPLCDLQKISIFEGFEWFFWCHEL